MKQFRKKSLRRKFPTTSVVAFFGGGARKRCDSAAHFDEFFSVMQRVRCKRLAAFFDVGIFFAKSQKLN